MAEDLDDLLSLDHLLDETFLLREGSLLCHHVAGACAAEFPCDGQHESGEEAHNESHPHTVIDHHEEHDRDRERGLEDHRKRLANQLADRVRIVCVGTHDIAVGVGIKIFDRQGLHLIEHVHTQVL